MEADGVRAAGPEPAAVVAPPLDAALVDPVLIDALLVDIADALHDRPIQSIVAARLMLESAAGDGPQATRLHDRGIGALAAAGELSRDIMWTLDRQVVGPLPGRADVEGMFARAAGPDRDLSVSVELGDGAPGALVRTVLAACADLVTDAVLHGRHLRAVQLDHADGVVTAEVETGPDHRLDDRSPWVRLAAARLAAVSGTISIGSIATIRAPDRGSPPPPA